MFIDNSTYSIKKPRLFVCGDSFCTQDPEYGESWIDLLIKSLPNIEVVNLASVGASNYLICLQVKEALKRECDYLIYHATSSTRSEFSLNHDTEVTEDNLFRYWSLNDQINKSVVSCSWHSPDNATGDLLLQKNQLIKEFFLECVDFQSMITKNFMFIDYTLKLITEKMPSERWAWSRGGYEHSRFASSMHVKFNKSSDHWNFLEYQKNHCAVNLWDNFDEKLRRPYFHVSEKNIQKQACEAYIYLLDLN